MSWSSGEPWVVAAAGPASWATVAAALVATGGARVAAVVIGSESADLLRSVAGTYVAVPVADHADDVVRIASALAPTHDRVVVTAPGGLLAPLGGFTLADVAWALRAPVVVAAGPGTANDVRLTLEVLERRHIPASVVAVGPTEDLGDLPVALAGELPADAAELPDFAERAGEWLDPLFRTAPETPAPPPSRRTFTGKRIAIAALVLAVAALQTLYMVALFTDEPKTIEPYYAPLRGHVAIETPRSVPSPVDGTCSRAQPNVVPAWADEATTARVNAAWTRIETVLAARAPAAAASLRPGATRNALLAAQARMGVSFPTDLVASLQRHDGADAFEFPRFHRFLGLDEAYGHWLTTCRALVRSGYGGDWWHRSYVPFASAGDGGYLLLDQRPGAGGRVGDYYPEEGTRFEGRPRSLTEMLEAVATSLETGTPYAGRYRPAFLPDGTLDWEG